MEEVQQYAQFQRINSHMLPNFEKRNVSIVGKCHSFNDGILTLIVDQGKIEIENISELPENVGCLEIRGQVENQRIQAAEYTELPGEFDLEQYYKVVELMQGQFKELFYPN